MPSHRRRIRRLERADQSAAGPPSGERKPQAASPKTQEQQPKAKSTGGRASGGQASASASSTRGQSGVRGSWSARATAGSARDTRGRMKREEDEEHEKMDVDDEAETRNKPSAMGARGAGSPTGKSDHRDSGRWIGSRDTDEELQPPTGGEGDHGGSSDSQDSDSGGLDSYVEIEKPLMTKTSWDAAATGEWKGVPLHRLQRTPDCLPPDVKLERSNQHYFAIKIPFEYGKNRKPMAHLSKVCWDKDHVRMPFADDSKCMRKGREKKRWEVIVEALSAQIPGTFELEEAILKYNQRYINKWKFTVLHHYFTNCMSEEDCQTFFDTVLPLMAQLALQLPDVCPLLPLLKKGKAKKVTLSQYQIASLLANAFFCTFPLRNARTRATEYAAYPDINFAHLFVGDPVPRKVEKLRCIIHYFKRVMEAEPSGIVTFSRQVLPSDHSWRKSLDNLTQLHVSSTGTIEDNGRGMLQVDFANKYIGGGVLGHGCVQEEIRFMMCPEMIVTRLFTEALEDNESLVMTGCEQYSKYEGYSDTFRWKGNFLDQTKRDPHGRLCCEVVAIDAQVFRLDYNKQFELSSINRELNKAYCGFKTSNREEHRSAVCTGNWGCGAFGGDKELKALIQVLAASVAKRDVCYFTFGDDWLTNHLFAVHDRLRRENKTVGEVYAMLVDYRYTLTGGRHRNAPSLFKFIHERLDQRKPVSRPPQHRELERSDRDPFFLSARDKADAEERSRGRETLWSTKDDSKKEDNFFSQDRQDQKNAGSKSSKVDFFHDRKEEKEESGKDSSSSVPGQQHQEEGPSTSPQRRDSFEKKNVDSGKEFSANKGKTNYNNS